MRRLLRSSLLSALMLPFAASLSWADSASALQALRAGDYATALKGFEAAAEAGDPRAEYWLGHMYSEGLGVIQDSDKGAVWISKAAKGGVILAARDLGQMYLRGDGVLQDFDMARKWLEKAAYDNDPVAQRELGEIYAQGMGIKNDNVWAYVWFDYAAKNGDKEAETRRAEVVKTMSSNEISRAQDLAESIKDEIFHNASTEP
jgi:TPR repeat protein